MGRRGNSSRRSGSSQSRGSRGRSSSSSNSTSMILGGLGVLAVIAVAYFMMSGDDKKKTPKDTPQAKVESEKKKAGSNLDQTNSTASKTTRSGKKSVDMALMRKLKGEIDMSEYQEINRLIAEASKLKSRALEIRKSGNEAEFKKLMTQAVDTWRKSSNLSDNFLFEIDGRHDDLRDAMFKSESKRIHNASKQFRAYLNYESE